MAHSPRLAVLPLVALLLFLSAGAQVARGGAFSLHVRTDGSDTMCTGYVDAPATNAPDCALATLDAALPLAPDGGRVTIGAGGYSPGVLSRGGADVTIVGQGDTPPLLRLPSAATWFTCMIGAECAFKNLAFDGETAASLTRGIRVQGAATFTDVGFTNVPGSAIAVEGLASVTVDGSSFDHVTTGVDASTGATAEVTGSLFTSVATGMSVTSASATATGNEFVSVGTGIRSFTPSLSVVPSLVTALGNNFQAAASSLWDTSNGTPGTTIQAHFNRLSGKVAIGTATATGDIRNNWWGCNAGPALDLAATKCVKLSNASPVAHAPWLVMTPDMPFATRKSTTVGVSLRVNSAGDTVSSPHPFPDGIDVGFGASPSGLATVSLLAQTVGGEASAAMTIGATDGRVTITAWLDDQRVDRVVRIDRQPPATRITFPKDRARPDAITLIRGTASDPKPNSGIERVQVAVMRKTAGRCEFWTGMGWEQSACGKRTWLGTGGRAQWVASLAADAAAAPRRYWVYSRATDKAGNVSAPGFKRRANLVVIDVQ